MGNNINKRTIRVVELFAGVGGFRLGLERASSNFLTIYANQWEPGRTKQWAFECYVSHFGESENHTNEDIAIVKNEIPQHDLLVGGFPCQDYSVAHGNNAKGIQGKKGVLWWEIIDIIKNQEPSLILLENVDRLIRSPHLQRGRDFGIMLKTLFDAGYDCEWRVINAADYGHPQRRKRIFIFAYKRNLRVKMFGRFGLKKLLLGKGFFSDIFPIREVNKNKNIENLDINSSNFSDLVDLSENFTSNFYNSGVMIKGVVYSTEVIPKKEKETTLREILETGEVDERFFIKESLEKIEYLKSSKRIERINPIGEPYIYSEGQMFFPDLLDRPARTMLTSEASINRSTHVIEDVETSRFRFLTPIEAERLNGFDDNWTNTGMPERFRYFTMGNALVVPLITTMGKKIEKLWGRII